MIKHRISYNISFDEKLEDVYNNAAELRTIPMPKSEISDAEVWDFIALLRPDIYYQFDIYSVDYDNICEDGLPEMVFQGHLSEWITENHS